MRRQLCKCGCGQPAPVAKRTRRDKGVIKGQVLDFIPGHRPKPERQQLAERRCALAVMVGRYCIAFTDHALDRWWERVQRDGPVGRPESRRRLRAALVGVTKLESDAPPWSGVDRYHKARTDGYLLVGDDVVFPIVRDPDGARVATTCLTRRAQAA